MRIIVAFALLLCSSLTQAAGINSREDARALANDIVARFVENDFSGGLAIAKAHWPLPAVEIDNLENQITTQWAIVEQRFGKVMGMEFIKADQIGQSFTRFYYLHKFANHALYWRIGFYKPNDVWKVNGITFRDQLEELYETVD